MKNPILWQLINGTPRKHKCLTRPSKLRCKDIERFKLKQKKKKNDKYFVFQHELVLNISENHTNTHVYWMRSTQDLSSCRWLLLRLAYMLITCIFTTARKLRESQFIDFNDLPCRMNHQARTVNSRSTFKASVSKNGSRDVSLRLTGELK